MLAAPLVALPAVAAEPLSGKRTVLNDVHTDAIDVQYAGGELRLRTRIGNQPYTYAEATEVIFQLKDVPESAVQVPDDPMFAFLGPAGDPIWLAPQTQAESLLFAGWDTESIPNGVLAGDTVDLTLTGVKGPGRVEVFQDGSFGEPVRIFSSSDAAFKTLHQPVASHAHANWVFSALGRYELTFKASAAGLESAPVTYTWYVGGSTANDIVATPTTTSLTWANNELTASVSPSQAKGWIEFRDGAAVLGSAAMTGGTAKLSPALGVGRHSLTAHFIPLYDNDFGPSVSAAVPVTITNPVSPSPSASTSPSSSPSASASTSAPAPATSTAACVQTSRRILDHEHVDYAVRVVNGRLESGVKEGSTWFHPSDVVLHVKPQAVATVPASGFDFLGTPGSRVWQIPQTQQSGIIWLGWNTESVSAGVNWSLTKVSGPGRV
ncbi:MAG TPA: hypothetical protein DGT23_17175, partial [Micromonosporaceae bacterium]|nr:hypothetical protein [Micromonosporaceae bacterium]